LLVGLAALGRSPIRMRDLIAKKISG